MADTDLTEQAISQVPEARRKIMDDLLEKLGGSENCRLLLALVAAASKRERNVVRLLIRELDLFDIAQEE